MSFSVFLQFDGNCREAVTFYAYVFDKEVPDFICYGGESLDPNFRISEEMKNSVMYSDLCIGGTNLMFCDMPPEFDFIQGNRVALVFGSRDEAEVRTVFSRLSEGGRVDADLQETFWSGLYGMVTDRFGFTWQINLDGECL